MTYVYVLVYYFLYLNFKCLNLQTLLEKVKLYKLVKIKHYILFHFKLTISPTYIHIIYYTYIDSFSFYEILILIYYNNFAVYICFWESNHALCVLQMIE